MLKKWKCWDNCAKYQEYETYFFFPKSSSAMRGKFNQSFVYSDIYNSEIHRPGKAGK